MSDDFPAEVRRSPELLSRKDSALLVVDVQEKLLPLIPRWRYLVWNIRRLIEAAQLLSVPCYATEQYPQGLGPTHPELAARLGERPWKRRFSCCGCGTIPQEWAAGGRTKIVVAGIETHVCVLQTVMDLLSEGFRVYVVADAVAARHSIDHEIALRRMDSHGATLTTCESVMFEWCETSELPQFKQISQLIREAPPEG
jgi:nicotinamidase-related amidase